MLTFKFLLGVLVSLGSGLINNLGNLLQKKAVNDYLKVKIHDLSNSGELSAQKYSELHMNMKTLMLNKTWIFGFGMQSILGTALFIWGQMLIGPSLTPAIGSFGLIVLVFASVLVQEKLSLDEYFGIFIMIAAVFLLGFSDLTIDTSQTDFLEANFLYRVGIFTGFITFVTVFCKFWAKKKDKHEGTMLACVSGNMIALSNFWISPVTTLCVGLVTNNHTSLTFKHHSLWIIVLYFLVSLGILIFVNVYAVYERQLAFRVGHAATMIPISHVPSHLSSPVLYSLVFWLPQPQAYSLAFMWVGIVLLLVASFIFGKREAIFEQKQQIAQEIVPLV